MEKDLKQFVEKVEKILVSEKKGNRSYFVGYGIEEGKKILINVFIDDRDIEKMSKADLLSKLQAILNELNPPKKMSAKPILISDINENNIWEVLGDSCVIKNIKILTTFLNIKLPENFQIAFEELPEKFKLEDLRRELKKLTKKDYHRNTYQNWMKFLIKAEFVTLKEKTYYKTPRINRYQTLKKLKE
ncbi:MAG: hypothetical protein PHD81_03720 [Candidatus Nanoarchaeia archaeon]|nr:hypothetical protein [Candidatus Nanoarchaeia archaeon]MDD5588191.1 hypothetical protein [Candidatus Nanoarchaeia archaeon]